MENLLKNIIITDIFYAVFFAAYLALAVILFIKSRKVRNQFLGTVLSKIPVIQLFILAGLLGYSYFGQVQDYSVMIQGAEYEKSGADKYIYSQEQKEYLTRYGNPDDFEIMFFRQGNETVRRESWYFYEENKLVSFEEGVKVYEEINQLIREGKSSTEYTPDMFSAEQKPGDILDAISAEEFIYEKTDNNIVQNGMLIYCRGIVLGFSDEKPAYIETISINPEEVASGEI